MTGYCRLVQSPEKIALLEGAKTPIKTVLLQMGQFAFSLSSCSLFYLLFELLLLILVSLSCVVPSYIGLWYVPFTYRPLLENYISLLHQRLCTPLIYMQIQPYDMFSSRHMSYRRGACLLFKFEEDRSLSDRDLSEDRSSHQVRLW